MIKFPIDSKNKEEFYLQNQYEDFVLRHTSDGKWFIRAKDSGFEYPAVWGVNTLIDKALLMPKEITKEEYENY